MINCILWKGAISPEGYGRLGDNLYAHRIIYQMFYGKIPKGLVIDHLCRIRNCVNPSHLEVVTAQVNVLRGLQSALKTHCKSGHEYKAGNTLFQINTRNGNKARYCAICKCSRDRIRYTARKDKQP